MSTLHNQVHLIGRAGHEVTLRLLSDGTPLARLRLYQRDAGSSIGQQRPPQTFQLVAWKATATQLHRLVRRGDRVLVQGRLHNRSVERDGRREQRTEIHVYYFTVLSGRGAAAATEPTPSCLNEPQTVVEP